MMGLIKKFTNPKEGGNWWRKLGCDRENDCFEKFWRGDQVQVQFKNWTITLNTDNVTNGESNVTVTRMRAPYVILGKLRLKIYRQDFLSKLGKTFGARYIESGDHEFDRDFFIQGNDEKKIKSLLAQRGIRQLIQAQPMINLEVKHNEGWFAKNFPPEVDLLCFQTSGFINDAERLMELFTLFAEILTHLCYLGVASPDRPKIEL